MIPAKFDYVRPSSLDEAVRVLASDEDAKVIAGGQSLLPLLRLRFAYPSTLVDLGAVESLRSVRDDGSCLEIGALVTHYELTRDPLIGEHAGLLAQAAGTIADPAVRHRGTIGGALSHADPAGDLPAVITALDADLVITGPSGTREVKPGDFFSDYFTTTLEPGEILTAIRVPKLAGWGYRYEKFHVTAQAWAIVGVAALARRENGHIAEARVGLTNMGSVPVRASGVEAAAVGVEASLSALASAGARADEGTNPPDDLRAAADYRRHLARVLTGRALATAAGASLPPHGHGPHRNEHGPHRNGHGPHRTRCAIPHVPRGLDGTSVTFLGSRCAIGLLRLAVDGTPAPLAVFRDRGSDRQRSRLVCHEGGTRRA